MKIIYIILFCLFLFLLVFLYILVINKENQLNHMKENSKIEISLPEIKKESQTSVEEALLNRRSYRSFLEKELSISQISQLLWSAYGITEVESGFKTTPSAGALYPLEIYIVINQENKDLDKGVYKYNNKNHKLFKLKSNSIKEELTQAALGQDSILQAPVVLVIAGDYQISTSRYGDRGHRYVYMEAGHAAQNVYLQVVSLNLGTVVIGAFDDEKVKNLLNLKENEEVFYLMPIGEIY